MDCIWRGDLLKLGRQGENAARTLSAYITDWQTEFPGCAVRLFCIRPGESVPYIPEGIATEGSVFTWTPDDTDTALNGYGQAELQAILGDTVVKSAVIKTFIEPCLPGTETPVPPSPLDNWMDTINGKQDAPATAGTAGQVLGLNADLEPVWMNGGGGGGGDLPSGGSTGDVLMKTADGMEWSDDVSELKSAINEKVSNTDYATASTGGVVKVGGGQYGISILNGTIMTADATEAEIKAGAVGKKPIAPQREHAAAFYGLAKAAGDTTQSASSNAVGTYTDEAKAAIRTMLGVTGESGMNIVSLSGTVIDQTGAANTMYVCGEVASLTFAAPASGICAIRFTSGTTATVATFTGVTSWMNGFDPTALEANKVYEINVLNGVGCAGWA